MAYPQTQAFLYTEKNGCGVLQVPALQNQPMLRHCFTTRIGGVSEAPFASLNMGLRRSDSRENLMENYRRVCEALHFDFNKLTLVNYNHGTGVAIAKQADAGTGVHKSDFPFECDGIVTNVTGLPLVTLHADCLAVFLLDPVKKAIGLCHAGWRGVEAGVAVETLHAMQEAFGSQATDCIAGVGAGIGPCCFEVDEDIAAKFADGFGEAVMLRSGAKPHVNLHACVAQQLEKAGLLPNHITLDNHCTCCDEALFYSLRRDQETGAMAAIMQLV
ncbi:MAG: peptidoglycan editing factor PgeF [Christensenellales bacterium]|jgi:YfiH family protein